MNFVFTTGRGGSSFVSISGGTGGSNFGAETISKVDCAGSARLNGTKVLGKVDAGGSVVATNSTIEKSIDAGGSATLTSTICKRGVDAGGSITAVNVQAETLDAGGSITATNSVVTNEVDAGGSITANQCQLGIVNAGGSVDLAECAEVQSVSGDDVTLSSTTVKENVDARGKATITHSEIRGTLTNAAEKLSIEGSVINTINLRSGGDAQPDIIISNGGISMFNNAVIGAGSRISTGNIMCASVIVSGNKKQSFINGVPVNQLKPTVKKESSLRQILELHNSTVKDIIFEGKQGEVILFGNSKVTGNITGGKIKA